MNDTRVKGIYKHTCPICGVTFFAPARQEYCSQSCVTVHNAIVNGDPEHAHERAMAAIERVTKKEALQKANANAKIVVTTRGRIPGGNTVGGLSDLFSRWH